jgi:lysozyme
METLQEKLEQVKQICTTEFLVPFEGTGPRDSQGNFLAYRDPGSKDGLPITIAWGLTFDLQGNKFQLGDKLSYEQALKIKQGVLNRFIADLLTLSPKIVLEPSSRIAAVLSWVYNCGLGNYRVSTFRKKVNEGRWEEAAEQCLKWTKANGKVMKGLVRRRQAEAKALLNP